MKKKDLKRKIGALQIKVTFLEQDIHALICHPNEPDGLGVRLKHELNFMSSELAWNGSTPGDGFGGILQEQETKQESTTMCETKARQIVSTYLKDNGGLIPICDTVIYRVQVQPQAFEEWTFIGLIKFIYDLK